MIFKNRQDAGQKLLEKLKKYTNQQNIIVAGLPRGGVPIAFEIAKGLNLPLDIIVNRKLRAQLNPELAIGAITTEGELVLNEDLIKYTNTTKEYLKEECDIEQKEALRRLKLYRNNRPPLNLTNKTIILVDDGIATGATIKAAIKSANSKGASKIIIAIPVSANEILQELIHLVDEVICLFSPANLQAISMYYQNFEQVEDEQVIKLIKESKAP